MSFLAQVARNLFGEEEFYKATIEDDEYIKTAIYEMLEDQWFHQRDGRLYLSPS